MGSTSGDFSKSLNIWTMSPWNSDKTYILGGCTPHHVHLRFRFQEPLLLKFLFHFMCMAVLSACISTNLYAYSVPLGAWRGYQIPWNWHYGMVVSHYVGARIEPGSSGSIASALNHWTLSPTSGIIFIMHLVPLGYIVLMIVFYKNDQSLQYWHLYFIQFMIICLRPKQCHILYDQFRVVQHSWYDRTHSQFPSCYDSSTPLTLGSKQGLCFLLVCCWCVCVCACDLIQNMCVSGNGI